MKKLTNFLQIFTLIITLFAIQSCREDAIEIAELDRTDVNSYKDLFHAFWDTMNNDYNYFNEQDRNWDDIYREYSPKFDVLTTFNKTDASPVLAKKEANLAFKYFAEIITNNVLDQHFFLGIRIPLPSVSNLNRTTYVYENFINSMDYTYSEEDGFINLGRTKRNPVLKKDDISTVMEGLKLNPSTIYSRGPILSGFLQDNPETMYIQLSSFKVTLSNINSEDLPLVQDISNLQGINQSFFDNLKSLDSANGTQFETLIKNNLNEFKAFINTILTSTEYQNYLDGLNNFKDTELVEDLESSLVPLAQLMLDSKISFYSKHINISDQLNNYIRQVNITEPKKNAASQLLRVYNKKVHSYETLSGYLYLGYFNGGPYEDFLENALFYMVNNSVLDIYKKLYNPITNGTAKKIILDLRGNSGGIVLDARIFTERFITQQEVWGYQRTKEGNGRFNYSPWVPIETKPHKFALNQNIPIAILIDNKSLSMSEISTMMIKSQGNHVTVLGDNSYGGTAGLGGQDDFNGGNTLSNPYLRFYMPLMALKDSQGNVIEAIGVTPDIKVIPTQEQAYDFLTTGIDPVFNAALEAIN